MSSAWQSRVLAVLAFVTLAAVGLTATAIGGARQSPAGPASDGVLNGTIDIHMHTFPDSEPWAMDSIDVAKLAKARGMRGIVLKSHWEQTASVAYLVRKEVPGLEVFGGLCLSRVVGGINVAAVEDMAHVTGGYGRVVWMPTLDSENQVIHSNSPNRPFVRVARNGELLPEVKEVISVIAKDGLVLATGHSSAEEDLMLVHEGRKQGVQHMVVTHAMSNPVRMNIAQMKEAASTGAYIELVYVHTLTNASMHRTAQFTMADVARAVHEVGAQSIILATDMGQIGFPPHPDGLAAFITGLRAEGITQRELDLMSKENPARLLGLSVH